MGPVKAGRLRASGVFRAGAGTPKHFWRGSDGSLFPRVKTKSFPRLGAMLRSQGLFFQACFVAVDAELWGPSAAECFEIFFFRFPQFGALHCTPPPWLTLISCTCPPLIPRLLLLFGGLACALATRVAPKYLTCAGLS